MRLAVLAAAIAAAGCTLPGAHVAQGYAYTTGNAKFDEFFSAVKAARADGIAAPNDEQAARAGLYKALGLDAKTAASKALEEATARAKKLRDKGVLLHLEIAPEPKLIVAKGKADPGADGAMLKAVEDAARSSLELRKRLEAVSARAADLEKKRAELRAQTDDAFPAESLAKRDEIKDELEAAKAVLAGAGDAASLSAGSASRFVVDLVQAVETGAAPDAVKPGRGVPTRVAGGRAPAAAPVRVAAPPAAPSPPPPKKKAKGGDDFEP
jgi:hypothetical protein